MDLIQHHGLETYRECTRLLIEQTERIVREEIRSWPDGSYCFEDYMDTDGVGGPPVKIKVNLTVAGDTLTPTRVVQPAGIRDSVRPPAAIPSAPRRGNARSP